MPVPCEVKEQTVVEEEVRALLKPAAGVAPEGLIGTGFGYRCDWGDLHGQYILNLGWGAVNARSLVFVAIGEGAPGGPDGGKFIGQARFTLYNVAPHDGGVSIWVNVEWGNNIRLYADYLVINP